MSFHSALPEPALLHPVSSSPAREGGRRTGLAVGEDGPGEAVEDRPEQRLDAGPLEHLLLVGLLPQHLVEVVLLLELLDVTGVVLRAAE